MTRNLLILAIVPLLCACPREQKDATVTWSDGRPVFDTDRQDCIYGAAVHVRDSKGFRDTIWSVGRSDTSSRECLPLPFAYGTAPSGWTANPADTPALQRGSQYEFEAEARVTEYVANFTTR